MRPQAVEDFLCLQAKRLRDVETRARRKDAGNAQVLGVLREVTEEYKRYLAGQYEEETLSRKMEELQGIVDISSGSESDEVIYGSSGDDRAAKTDR